MEDNEQKFQINGRLGNQMFQFAHIYSILSKSDNKNYSISCDCKDFGINISQLEYKPNDIYPGTYKKGYKFLGYHESELYFDANVVSKIYSIPDELRNSYIRKYGCFENTLFISVRRGDFVSLKHLFVCLKASFYEDMYKNLNKKYDKIFLSTDDYEWCKQNIHIPQDIIYLKEETPYNTVMLASLCKDFIISNSTFSWWCAWLGEKNGGRILCPNHHFINSFNHDSDKIYYPDRWEKKVIENYCEK